MVPKIDFFGFELQIIEILQKFDISIDLSSGTLQLMRLPLLYKKVSTAKWGIRNARCVTQLDQTWNSLRNLQCSTFYTSCRTWSHLWNFVYYSNKGHRPIDIHSRKWQNSHIQTCWIYFVVGQSLLDANKPEQRLVQVWWPIFA